MARIAPLIASIGCAAALVGCGDDSMDQPAAASEEPAQSATQQTAPSAEPDPSAEPAAARGPLVKLRDSQFGPVLFSGSERAVYTFTRDPKGKSRCRGDCAEAWPPFFARARPRAGRGVKRSLLGTIRRGSRRQVTYRGQPLYFYVSDPRGEVLCNDIVEFGGTWYAVTAEGDPPA